MQPCGTTGGQHLARPIDVAALAVFRIAAGLLIALELANDLLFGDFAEYVGPAFHFSYPFFGWLTPWPPLGMSIHFALAIALALAVAAGALTRFTAPLLFLVWTSLFLMERAEYVNHTYLYCWVTFWLAVLPVGRAASLDVWLGRERPLATVPAWMQGVLVLQMALVYLFAGVAKLDADWLAGVPQRLWFPGPRSFEILHPLLAHRLAPLVIAWGGIAFDLGIVPALLWRRTRPYAFVVAVLFHVTNVALLGLASFPWFSIAATTLFFDPSWPRRFAWLERWLPARADLREAPCSALSTRLLVGLAVFAAFHVLMPLRQHLYPGDVAWTEQGHMFSWRMMVRTKSGRVLYRVVDPATGRLRVISPAPYLSPAQLRELPGQPDMILQLAHFLAAEEARAGRPGARVYADVIVRLNGRRARPLIDWKVDLAAERWTWRPWPWILPSPRDSTRARASW